MQPVDYIIIAIYLLMMVILGTFIGRRQHNTEDFFLAGRSLRWWPIAISLFASLFSAISYIAIPGEGFNFGLNMMLTFFSAFIALPGTLYIFLRLFYDMRLFTVNEYLEKRFSPGIRRLNSVLFIIMRLVYLGVVLYATAMLLEKAMGLPIWLSILLIGGISTIYTVLGGMAAVVWTDVVQFVVLLGGVFLIIFMIGRQTEGGLAGIWRFAAEHNRTFDVNADSTIWGFSQYYRISMWITIYCVPMTMISVASDQINLQRCLACKSFSEVSRAVVGSTLGNIPICFLFYFCGMAVFVYFFKLHPELVPAEGLQGDQAFCQYISHYLPIGCRGLLVASVLAAVMSTVDSVENSLATVFVKDIYQRFLKPNLTEGHYLKVAKYCTAAIGIGICLFGLCVNLLFGNRNVPLLELSNICVGILGTFSCAFFILGLLTFRANAKSLWVGIIVALPVELFLLFPMYLFREQSQRISYVYVSMVPRITTIVVGYAASWFFRNSDASSRPYVIWSRWSNWRRPTAFLVGMAIVFLLGIWFSISVIPRFSNRSKLLDVAGSQEFTWEGVHAAECLLAVNRPENIKPVLDRFNRLLDGVVPETPEHVGILRVLYRADESRRGQIADQLMEFIRHRDGKATIQAIETAAMLHLELSEDVRQMLVEYAQAEDRCADYAVMALVVAGMPEGMPLWMQRLEKRNPTAIVAARYMSAIPPEAMEFIESTIHDVSAPAELRAHALCVLLKCDGSQADAQRERLLAAIGTESDPRALSVLLEELPKYSLHTDEDAVRPFKGNANLDVRISAWYAAYAM